MDAYAWTMLEANRPSVEFPISTSDGPFTSLVHLHACRSGPLVANDIFLAIAEREKNPHLNEIVGIFQPFPTTAKMLSYWFAGLQAHTLDRIIAELIKADFLIEGENLSLQELAKLAQDQTAPYRVMVKAFAEPVLDDARDQFVSCGFSAEQYNKLLNLFSPDQPVSLETALVAMSTHIVNSLLEHSGLPRFTIIQHQSNFFDQYDRKFVDVHSLAENASGALAKQKGRRDAAFGEIAKRLKPFNGRAVSLERIKREYGIVRQKPKSACSAIDIPDAVLQDRFIGDIDARDAYRAMDVQDLIIAVLDGHKHSFTQDPTDAYSYVDGIEMIQVCFDYARQHSTPIALQEFIREGSGYERYAELHDRYPDVVLTRSATTVWNVETFPEFDLSLTRGLAYLGAGR
jgi:hypothetical protein